MEYTENSFALRKNCEDTYYKLVLCIQKSFLMTKVAIVTL